MRIVGLAVVIAAGGWGTAVAAAYFVLRGKPRPGEQPTGALHTGRKN